MSDFDVEAAVKAVKARMGADPEGTADAGIDAESIAKARPHPLASTELERTLPIEAASGVRSTSTSSVSGRSIPPSERQASPTLSSPIQRTENPMGFA